jgi:hypothetical protein
LFPSKGGHEGFTEVYEVVGVGMVGCDVGAEGVGIGSLGTGEGRHVEGEEEFEFGRGGEGTGGGECVGDTVGLPGVAADVESEGIDALGGGESDVCGVVTDEGRGGYVSASCKEGFR